MAYSAVSLTVPQYSIDGDSLASGYYLKGYESGTTTPLSMATDSTGGTTLAKCKLNTAGYPLSNEADDTSVFIPHFNAAFKLALYTNSTDADADTVANAVWVVDALQSSPASENYTPSGTSAVARTIQTKLDERISVKDFGAVADGSTDDSAAIQAAFDHAGSKAKVVFPWSNNDYIVNSEIVVTANTVWVDFEMSRVQVTHTAGAGFHFQGSNIGLVNGTVYGDATRDAAAAGTNFGIRIEGVDSPSQSVANAYMSNMAVNKHPGGAVIGVGTIETFTAIDCQFTDADHGHGFCADRGIATGRTNKSSPGQVTLINTKLNDNGGHGFCIGHPGDETSIPYRVTIENCDTGRSGTDSSVRHKPCVNYVKGENIRVNNCGLGGANTTNGDAEDLYSIYACGRNIELNNNRYIQCSPNAVTVGYQGQSTDLATITGATQANPVVVTTSAAHNLSTGQTIDISSVAGMTEINTNHTVTVVTSTTFSLDGVNGTGYTAYSSGGVVNGKSITTDGVEINGMRVISEEAPLNPAVIVESGCVNVAAESLYDANITSLMTAGVPGSHMVQGDSETYDQRRVAHKFQTFTDSDATPDVSTGNHYLTNTSAVTITDFDGGVAGQEITVISKGAITYDTTATNLEGSSVDIVTANNDVTRWVSEDGTTWRLIAYVDSSVDNSAGA